MAERVADARALDLDHVGAEVAEQHAELRARDEPRQIEDADAAQGARVGARVALARQRRHGWAAQLHYAVASATEWGIACGTAIGTHMGAPEDGCSRM